MVVAPGGIGTLLELMYVWQLIQIGIVESRSIVLLDGAFWKGLLEWMHAEMGARSYINPDDLNDVYVVDTPDQAVKILAKEQAVYMRENNVQPTIGEAVVRATVQDGGPGFE